jgi:peptide chain release factor 2
VLEKELVTQEVWENPSKSQELLKEKSAIENTLKPLTALIQRLDDLHVMIELSEDEEGGVFLDEIDRAVRDIKSETDDLEVRSILSSELDINNAIITIHPGAGGIESQDWAQMLMRMYLRWAERKDYKVQIVDLLPGEEAGIKSVTMTVSGNYAYGYLKAEAGVHRLVRISPFDANKRRHTSFAAVLVYPEVSDAIEVELRDEDIKMDTFRASGAGGQHVNKTDSAVRLTHIPSGIIVSCQNERSQHKNRAVALKIMRARLYAMIKEEQDKKMEEHIGKKKDIAWGSQIRSYILQPYQLVKDHRTGIETGNVNAVIDGDIDAFINGYLMQSR